jgi:hypothetical protein
VEPGSRGVTVEWLLHGDQVAPPGEIVVCRAAPQLTEHAPESYDARPVAPLDFTMLIEVVAAVEDYFTLHRLRHRSIPKARLVPCFTSIAPIIRKNRTISW